MPIIIDEVVISVEVNSTGNQSKQNSNQEIAQDLIDECVEQVLDVLQQREER